jgi:16S rRNA G966 N2-methylase RsmD
MYKTHLPPQNRSMFVKDDFVSKKDTLTISNMYPSVFNKDLEHENDILLLLFHYHIHHMVTGATLSREAAVGFKTKLLQDCTISAEWRVAYNIWRTSTTQSPLKQLMTQSSNGVIKGTDVKTGAIVDEGKTEVLALANKTGNHDGQVTEEEQTTEAGALAEDKTGPNAVALTEDKTGLNAVALSEDKTGEVEEQEKKCCVCKALLAKDSQWHKCNICKQSVHGAISGCSTAAETATAAWLECQICSPKTGDTSAKKEHLKFFAVHLMYSLGAWETAHTMYLATQGADVDMPNDDGAPSIPTVDDATTGEMTIGQAQMFAVAKASETFKANASNINIVASTWSQAHNEFDGKSTLKGTASLVFLDPPYNGSERPTDADLPALRSSIDYFSKEGSVCIIFCDPFDLERYRGIMKVTKVTGALKMPGVWKTDGKPLVVCRRPHPHPPRNSQTMYPMTEFALVAYRLGPGKTKHSNIMVHHVHSAALAGGWPNPPMPHASNVISDYVPPRLAERLKDLNGKVWRHCAEKSFRLLGLLIEKYTVKGELVMDLFAGTASLGVTCVAMQRRYFGIEKVKELVTDAQHRLGRAHLAKKAGLQGGQECFVRLASCWANSTHCSWPVSR